MYYVCNSCYEVYSNMEFKGCPKVICAGEIIQIDELMIPAFISLNKKGYNTKMCCSSHEFGFSKNSKMYGAKYPYINFNKEILRLPSIPDGFIEKRLGGKYNNIIRLELAEDTIENPSTAERQWYVFNGIINLTKWADELPQRKSPDQITFIDVINKLTEKDQDVDGDVFNVTEKYSIFSNDYFNTLKVNIENGIFLLIKKERKLNKDYVSISLHYNNSTSDYLYNMPLTSTIDGIKNCFEDENKIMNLFVNILTEFVNM